MTVPLQGPATDDPAIELTMLIKAIVKALPDFSSYGFRMREGSSGNSGIAFEAWRLATSTPQFTRQVSYAIKYLMQHRIPAALGSYALKHRAERAAGHYITNGAAIAAALISGYSVVRDGEYQPNCTFKRRRGKPRRETFPAHAGRRPDVF